MKLFHESENKYYELLSYLLSERKEFSDRELEACLNDELGGSRDYDIEHTLFSHDPDRAAVFIYEEGKYCPVIENKLPVRNNRVELQAVHLLTESPYGKQFLSQNTLEKLKQTAAKIEQEWTLNDIDIKSQSADGVSSEEKVFQEALAVIIKAIKSHRAIQYDNTLPGRYEYIDAVIYPVRVEYSFINDLFRICGYNEEEDRFIKNNLATMSNVRLRQDTIENLEAEYKEYLELNTKKVVLDVEPVGHVIERCFRIFSFYDRQAKYDRDSQKYTLEIKYLKSDESEVIRDILSLGGYVVVTEPRRIQKEVYKRILQARERYR